MRSRQDRHTEMASVLSLQSSGGTRRMVFINFPNTLPVGTVPPGLILCSLSKSSMIRRQRTSASPWRMVKSLPNTPSIMERFRTGFLIALLALICGARLQAQICTGTPATTVSVGGGSIAPTSNLLTITTTANVFAGMSVGGPGIVGGTTVQSVPNGTQVILSQNSNATGGGPGATYTFGAGLVPNATWNPATVTGTPWANNYPPNAAGNCNSCPSLFSTTICNSQYARMWMCAGKVYTISLCNSPTVWNSTLSITTSAWAAAGGFTNYDNNSCTDGQHATLTFAPTGDALYYIRVSQDPNPCLLPRTTPLPVIPLQCATLEISCAPAPSGPSNDNLCGGGPPGLGAVPLTIGSTCAPTAGGTAWSTQTTTPNGTGLCAALPGYDVWYSVQVPPLPSTFALQVTHVGATDLAMAVYSAPACNSPQANWTLLACNDDIAPGVFNPYLNLSLPALAGQTVWIRIYPEGGGGFGGTFEICAVEVIPPPNDNPCNATPVPVTAGCSTITSTNEYATPTGGIGAPTCGTPAPYNDVWFTVQIPTNPLASEGVVINTSSTALDDAVMAVYLASPDCNGTFTQVAGACNNPAAAFAMPTLTVNQNGTTIVDGTTLYVRVWNRTAGFGPFTICATPTTPPPNDDPCGAIAVPVQYGCLFSGFTNALAGTTGTTAPNTATNGVPNPVAPCAAAAPAADVWFTIQVPNPVPPNIVLDTDNGTMANAAFAVYRIASGSCGGGDLSLTQIGCSTGGSANSATMPVLTLPGAGLVANETLYIRVWRESGATTANTFQLCARRTDPVPGDCNFTLQMFDSGGDGWNGGYVTVQIVGGSTTNYTINSANGSITFAANFGQTILISYTAVGGFQNQISYQLLASSNNGLIFNSGTPPATGLSFALTVDTDCNVPPLPQEDCVGAHRICSATSAESYNPDGTGSVVDLNPSNQGCLITGENQSGVWYYFRITTSGQLGFTVDPFPYGTSDYDYGVWGPYTSFACPPVGPPIRCSWADGPSLTGLNYTATDLSEGVFGDSWTRYLDVIGGQWYILWLDNWYETGSGFNLTFQLQGGATIECTLPVELLNFTGKAIGRDVQLKWQTASERMSDHFIIERSHDGAHFQAIGRVEAAGNSSMLREYDYLDAEPQEGLNYYRLKQVDTDGTSETSHVITILFRTALADIEVVPNPALETLNAIFDLPADQVYQWRVTDASGRLVIQGTRMAVEGPDRLELPLQGIENGAYALTVLGTGTGLIGQARFVKQ